MKLLIADDEEIIRRGLSSLDWNRVGMDQVFLACDGVQAKRILMEEQIDVVISDIRMPELSGLELSEFIKEEKLDTMIIFLSGLSEFEYALAAIRNEVCGYLLKPVKPGELYQAVEEACQRLEKRRYQEQIIGQYEKRHRGKTVKEQMEELFPRVRPEVADILGCLAESYGQEVCLNSLAEQLHFSTAYVSKIIKKETGYSFSTILNAVRLFQSLEMLRDGGKKIQEISEQAGFLNQHYYSGVFKRSFGVSPNQYKKQERQEYTLGDVLEILERQKQEKGEY